MGTERGVIESGSNSIPHILFRICTIVSEIWDSNQFIWTLNSKLVRFGAYIIDVKIYLCSKPLPLQKGFFAHYINGEDTGLKFIAFVCLRPLKCNTIKYNLPMDFIQTVHMSAYSHIFEYNKNYWDVKVV